MPEDPIRVITVRDSFGNETTVLRQYPDGIYAQAWDQPVKLTRDQLATVRAMLGAADTIGPDETGPVTPADLDTWRDPAAAITILAPDEIPDTGQQSCMYHRGLTSVPIAVHITTHWPMIGAACQPCGESILAALHGTPWNQLPVPDAAIQAGEISLHMAKMIGHGPQDATVTTLRARVQAESLAAPDNS